MIVEANLVLSGLSDRTVPHIQRVIGYQEIPKKPYIRYNKLLSLTACGLICHSRTLEKVQECVILRGPWVRHIILIFYR